MRHPLFIRRESLKATCELKKKIAHVKHLCTSTQMFFLVGFRILFKVIDFLNSLVICVGKMIL